MNEKLTAEQLEPSELGRFLMYLKDKGIEPSAREVMRFCSHYNILTAHTEPEFTVHEWEHMSEEDKQAWCESQPNCFPATEPEDELIINDWDDCWHSIGQCGNPECWRCTLDTTEITLRKIEEYIKILSINPISNRIRINTMLDCKDWLQQEGKKSLGYYPDGQPVEDTCPRCGGKWKKAWKKEKQKQWQVDMCQDCGKER